MVRVHLKIHRSCHQCRGRELWDAHQTHSLTKHLKSLLNKNRLSAVIKLPGVVTPFLILSLSCPECGLWLQLFIHIQICIEADVLICWINKPFKSLNCKQLLSVQNGTVNAAIMCFSIDCIVSQPCNFLSLSLFLFLPFFFLFLFFFLSFFPLLFISCFLALFLNVLLLLLFIFVKY